MRICPTRWNYHSPMIPLAHPPHLPHRAKLLPRGAPALTTMDVFDYAEPTLDEAAAHYKKALDMEPDNARAHINLGNVLRAGGKLDEAIAHYVKALDIEPDNAGAHINLGNILRAGGRLGANFVRRMINHCCAIVRVLFQLQ